VLKSLSNARWAAHAVATRAVLESSKIVEALEFIDVNQSQKGETTRKVENVANKKLEIVSVFMLTMWHEI
jgi:hypothetical protein